MRIVLSSMLLAGLAVSTAHAADAVIDYQPAPVVYDSFNWTGFYVGGQVGYAFAGGTDLIYPEDEDYNYDLDPRGFLGGVHAGYNHQLANGVVLGVEGDLNWARIDDSGASDDDYTSDYRIDWTGSVRGRVGYAIDRLMPYLTAGVAFGGFRFTEFDDGVFDSSGRDNFVGWTVGVGAEYALTNNWSIRTEYRYTDFGSTDFQSNYDGGSFDYIADSKTHDIRIGASYKF